MNFSSSNNRPRFASSKFNSTKTRPPLTLEQLEARMLMAVDFMDQQLAQINQDQPFQACLSVESSLPELEATPTVGRQPVVSLRSESVGRNITSGARIETLARQISLQIPRDTNGNLPAVRWAITSRDSLAVASAQQSGDTVTLSFNRPVDYSVSAFINNRRLSFSVRVLPTLKSLTVSSGSSSLNNAPLTSSTRSVTLTVNAFDEIGRRFKTTETFSWEILESPANSTPILQVSGAKTRFTFDRAGTYKFKVTNAGVSSSVQVNIQQVLSRVQLSPGTSSIARGETLQFTATGLDQFLQPMQNQPQFSWAATGGTINPNGLYTAGTKLGNYRVTVRAERFSATSTVSIANSTNSGDNNNGGGGTQFVGIQDQALRNLVSTFYVDNVLSREEMMQLLRNTASDNTISSTELTDLRYIVSANSNLRMADYVRVLTTNIVTSNPANLNYQGQAAGNLVGGSSGTLMNTLVDKWFMGTDLPALTSNTLRYQAATGSLFPTNPSLDDSRQGMLGDCYYLAALIAVAAKNPTAIRNMFIENNDGTVSVRFFANGKTDYVTVNRQLPVYGTGSLIYTGYGRSVTSPSTPLWLALAEKAYAQWNETGKAGRDGTNRYAAIEGGWMSNVNLQVLGYNSANHAVNSLSKQTLVNALSSNQAVTIGTTSGATAGGLVGSHAYVVTGYNSTSDTFSFYNPWSFQHPTNLTWSQMQGQFSYFVVTSPTGSTAGGATVSSLSPNVSLAANSLPTSTTDCATINVNSNIREQAPRNNARALQDTEVLIDQVIALDFSPASDSAQPAKAEYVQSTATGESLKSVDQQAIDLSLVELELI